MALYFLSDVHLSAGAPAITAVFTRTLHALAGRRPEAVFIMGDLFNAWIGDKAMDSFAHEIAGDIKALSAICPVFLQRGNRDFLLAGRFCDLSGAVLLPDIYVFEYEELTLRIEHGDLLCTDDAGYQRLRRVLRSRALYKASELAPRWLSAFVAARLRRQSKKRTAQKPAAITDVNAQAVARALQGADVLIHGHTHRPAVHNAAGGKRRFVLGDFRPEAKILCLDKGKFSILNTNEL